MNTSSSSSVAIAFYRIAMNIPVSVMKAAGVQTGVDAVEPIGVMIITKSDAKPIRVISSSNLGQVLA